MKTDVTTNEIGETFKLFIKYHGIHKGLLIWEENCSETSIQLIVEYILNGILDVDFKGKNGIVFMSWIYSDFILNEIESLFFRTKELFEANRLSIAYTIIDNGIKLKNISNN